MRIEIIVPGVPVAQPRQRHRVVAKAGKAPFVQNYTPKGHPVNDYKAAIMKSVAAAFSGPPLTGTVRADVLFVMERPSTKFWKTKPMPRYPHTGKPDRDNLDKAVMDAMTGIVWKDDSQVCDGRIRKVVASGYEQPHTVITISTDV